MKKIDELTKAKDEAAERAAQTEATADAATADVAESDTAVRQTEQRIAELTTSYEDAPGDDTWNSLVTARTVRDQHAARLAVRQKRAAKASADAATAAAELAEAERQVQYEHAREACEYSARHPELVERAVRVFQELAAIGREFEQVDRAAMSQWRTYCAADGLSTEFHSYRGNATRAARMAARAFSLQDVAYALNGVLNYNDRVILENTSPQGRWC